VTPKGTVGTAATAIGVGFSASVAPPISIQFDHPFLFLVRDTQTGAIVFSAAVNDPTAH